LQILAQRKYSDFASYKVQLHLMPMMTKLGLRERTIRPGEERSFWRSGLACRAGALLCVLLVFLTSFVAVAHFHPNNSGSTDHSCSLCALAHAGVAVNKIVQPVPILAPSILAQTAAVTSHSFLLIASHYIRPPPQA
jgi:hypothetical protein